jgi:hypothetical protein
MTITYYDSIETLPLYNFDKYRNTKDLNWFIEGFDGRQPKEANEKLQEIEKAILDEYFKAIDDRSFTNRLQKWAEIDSLKLKYSVVKSLIARMWMGFDNSQMDIRLLFIKQLALHGFKMPEINTIEGDSEELIRLNLACEGLKTRIALIDLELNKDAKKESVSLTRQLQMVTLGLQYPYRLNPKEITLLEWIEMCKILEEKTKQN